MTIYIDVIIIENLIMNYIILYATGIIAKVKIMNLRIIISSLIGALYAVLEYTVRVPIYSNFIIKLFLSIILVYIAFYPQDVKKLCKELLLFYLTSFVFGGVATYLIYTIKPQNIIMRNGIYVGSYIMKIIFLGGILGYIIITLAFKIVKSKITKQDMLCKVKIKLDRKETIVNAMIDTGNMLKEPITGLPVIVVEKNSLYELVPKDILNNLEEILEGNINVLSEDSKNKYISKLKVIPFSSLGRDNGMLLGLKAKEVCVISNEEERIIGDVIIGIYSKALTKRNEYNALIGLEI